jgi:hypothetical protein
MTPEIVTRLPGSTGHVVFKVDAEENRVCEVDADVE